MIKIEIIKGIAGYSLLINDYRVSGIKQSSVATIVASWEIDKEIILKALKIKL